MAKKPKGHTKPTWLVKDFQRKDHKISHRYVSHREARADKNAKMHLDLDPDSGYDTVDLDKDIIKEPVPTRAQHSTGPTPVEAPGLNAVQKQKQTSKVILPL